MESKEMFIMEIWKKEISKIVETIFPKPLNIKRNNSVLSKSYPQLEPIEFAKNEEVIKLRQFKEPFYTYIDEIQKLKNCCRILLKEKRLGVDIEQNSYYSY